MKFKNMTVVITGAVKGIGLGLAHAYAAEGAKVVLSDREEDEGRQVEQALLQDGFSAFFTTCDVRKEEDVVHLRKFAYEKTGSIDMVINNAGVSRWKSPYELTLDEWDDVLNSNARSCFLVSREAAKYMKNAENGGSIVNLSSTRSVMSEPNSEAYAASKGAIVSLTHALAVSLGPDGIRVNCISPGWIETGQYDILTERDHAQHPAGRVGRPDDIARACFYLTDPENTFVTGSHLVVDGGMTRKMIYEE
ncbi:SDR family oxidoreductase [Paenibacillus sp. N3/727]|uniref:SDR family NAD(P)-dependent oxidoreductase n=1 Tax=Paenibacillus sp. N3/727 TaxID=2925845 RepID=UPI001F531D49|nr:SDR family oxidoreductase [Paenibacillus sp. N3/727]UNK20923.1 SDR family oxidoreductase [Paenibacillus sp. N3/727]